MTFLDATDLKVIINFATCKDIMFSYSVYDVDNFNYNILNDLSLKIVQ